MKLYIWCEWGLRNWKSKNTTNRVYNWKFLNLNKCPTKKKKRNSYMVKWKIVNHESITKQHHSKIIRTWDIATVLFFLFNQLSFRSDFLFFDRVLMRRCAPTCDLFLQMHKIDLIQILFSHAIFLTTTVLISNLMFRPSLLPSH